MVSPCWTAIVSRSVACLSDRAHNAPRTAATWFLVLGGSIAALVAWRQGRLAPNWSFHFGLVLTGWGVFNVVEGLINHQLLGVHHVRDDLGGPLSWDIGFLIFGALLVVGGWLLHRRGEAALQSHITGATAKR